MTAFGTTWNAWLGFGAAVVCALLVLHVARRIHKHAQEGDGLTTGIYAEIATIAILAFAVIFLFYFSQRAGESEGRPSSVEERRAMEKSIEKAPPMSTKAEIKAAKKQQDEDNLVHSGKTLQERTDEANKAADEAVKRWEEKDEK